MKPCPSIAFDEAQRPVIAVEFPHDEVADRLDGEAEPSREDEARLRREILSRLLYFLTTRAGSKRIGQRVLVLAFIAGATPFKKQKQLAAKLGVSAGRASQILKFAKRELSKLAKPE